MKTVKISFSKLLFAAVFGLSLNAFGEAQTFPMPIEEITQEGEVLEDDSWQANRVDDIEVLEEDELTKNSDVQEDEYDETIDEIENSRQLKKAKKNGRLDRIKDKSEEAFKDIWDRLENLSIDFTLKLKTQIIDGVDFRVDYEYAAEPAYYGNFFTRLDGYAMKPKIKLLEALGIESKFGLSAAPSVEVRFYQFFNDLGEARKPGNGYSPKRMPFTAEDARNKLKPGDMVAFDGDINLAYGYSNVWDQIVDWLKLSIGGGGSLQGRLRMFIFKAEDDIVRLRVSALRSAPKHIKAKLRLFDLFDLGWSKLTELVENALNLDELVQAELRKINRDVFLADYTLDLKDIRVRSAYDAIFDRERRYRTIADIAYPFHKVDELRDILYERLKPVTDIAVGEQNKSNPKAVVNFMGSNFSKGGQFEFEGGLRGAWRGEVRRSKLNNKLKQVIYDADGVPHDYHYIFPSWLRRSEISGGFTLFRERKHQAANIVNTAEVDEDNNWTIKGFESIGFYREQTDKRYQPKEHEEILRTYRRVLPPKTYDDFIKYLEANNWANFDKMRENVRISARYFITEGGLRAIESRSEEEIQREVVKALHELDMTTKRFGHGGKVTGSHIPRCNLKALREIGVRTWTQIGRDQWRSGGEHSNSGEDLGEFTLEHCRQIKSFSKKLSDALLPNLTAEKRLKTFSKFSTSKLFMQVGAGVLFKLINGNNLDEEVSFFEFVINGREDASPVRFSRGKVANRPLYEIILQMERIMNEDQPDLRLPGNVDSIIRKKFDNLGEMQAI